MPANWLPWPGNTNAIRFEVLSSKSITRPSCPSITGCLPAGTPMPGQTSPCGAYHTTRLTRHRTTGTDPTERFKAA